MNKTTINVPAGIRYISQWPGFKLPEEPTIINKQICGCGFTEWCLGSPYNVILCSPRKILLENKADQHSEDSNIFYAKNELELVINADKDLNKVSASAKNDNSEELAKRSEEIKANIEKLHNGVKNHWMQCIFHKVPCKIIVTYDSFRHVREAIGEQDLKNFYIVVDEFQSIFTDAKFKSTSELEFLGMLQGISRLSFVSATPMVDEYLEMMDEFKDLPFVDMDWGALDPGRLMRPKLNPYKCSSIFKVAEKEITSYKEGNFKKKLFTDSFGNIKEIESKELVIYVNSVTNICEIIKKNKLRLEETNILCAKTSDNIKRVREAFNSVIREENSRIFERISAMDSLGASEKKDLYKSSELPRISSSFNDVIGKVPKRDEPNKMFTLCTRTVYLGADFYSPCARSLVLSDANSDCMSVDISLDLPQILGRQRLEENPWLNTADFYYKPIKEHKSLDELNKEILTKKERTESLLRIYDSTGDMDKHNLADNYEKVAISYNYRDDYVSVNKHLGSDKIPAFNNLVMLSEIRTNQIQQLDYKDRFSVIAIINYKNDLENTDFLEAFDEFNSFSQFTDKMRVLCDHPEIAEHVSYEYSNYLYALGPDRIKACQYRKYLLDEELEKKQSVQENSCTLKEAILDCFSIGCRYTKSDIKEKIRKIYNSLGITATPKALVLLDYFDVKRVLITNRETGLRDAGFEILKKL